jgi:glycosyltransferase involved in cell wall biosynthesis
MTLNQVPAPGLTVIVLTRNRRELLRGCLESLFGQSDPGVPLAFIVVDDGSSDGTGDMVRSLTATRPLWSYIFQEPAGIAAARNAGIRHCGSEWIAIVADDYLLPADYARSIAVFFREHPQARVVRFKVTAAAGGGWISGAVHAYQEASCKRRLAPRNLERRRWSLWRRLPETEGVRTDHGLEAAGAAAFHSSVFRQIGGFDESFPRGEDSDFTGRLRAAGIPVYYSPFLRIGHRYDPSLSAALKNAFAGGRASWRLHGATGQKPARVPTVIRVGLRSGPAALYWSCWRAWQAGSVARFIIYWPILLLMDAANRAGFFSACVGSRKKIPAAGHGRATP